MCHENETTIRLARGTPRPEGTGAWELKGLGWKPVRIAEALGVTRGAVSQWFKKAEAEGIEALYSRKASGPKPRLSDEQLQQLPELLD